MSDHQVSRCYSITIDVWVPEGTYFPAHIEQLAQAADLTPDDDQARMAYFLADAARSLGGEVAGMTSRQIDASGNVYNFTDPEGAA